MSRLKRKLSRQNTDKTLKKVQRYSVKAKLKMSKAIETSEDNDIITLKNDLKNTKHALRDISNVSRNLYNAKLNESKQINKLCHAIDNIKYYQYNSNETIIKDISNTNYFGKYLKTMSECLKPMELLYELHLSNMMNDFVIPFELFADKDIEFVQKIKIELKSIKGNYDVARYKYNNALTSNNNNKDKISKLKEKEQYWYNELMSINKKFKNAMDHLYLKKMDLLDHFKQYNNEYSVFLNKQNDILKRTINDMDTVYQRSMVFKDVVNKQKAKDKLKKDIEYDNIYSKLMLESRESEQLNSETGSIENMRNQQRSIGAIQLISVSKTDNNNSNNNDGNKSKSKKDKDKVHFSYNAVFQERGGATPGGPPINDESGSNTTSDTDTDTDTDSNNNDNNNESSSDERNLETNIVTNVPKNDSNNEIPPPPAYSNINFNGNQYNKYTNNNISQNNNIKIKHKHKFSDHFDNTYMNDYDINDSDINKYELPNSMK